MQPVIAMDTLARGLISGLAMDGARGMLIAGNHHHRHLLAAARKAGISLETGPTGAVRGLDDALLRCQADLVAISRDVIAFDREDFAYASQILKLGDEEKDLVSRLVLNYPSAGLVCDADQISQA